tara:strand:+ start:3894 stop:5783 length:1890 start_codon:yes stop_codon:yes gene_type:complete
MLDSFSQKLINLSKFSKVMLHVSYDFFAVFFSTLLLKSMENSFDFYNDYIIIIIISLFFPLASFTLGFYISFVRFFSTSSLFKTLLLTAITYALVMLFSNNNQLNIYTWISSLFFTFSIIILPRLILKELLRKAGLQNLIKVAIIGNDYESYELLDLLKHSKKYQPVCFLVDKNKGLLSNRSFPELSAKQFLKQSSKLGINLILAHEASVKKLWFEALLQSVAILKIPFFKSISIDQSLTSQNKNVSMQPISFTDYVVRSPHPPIKNLLKRNVSNKTVLITGGGGSIGSQLCKQILLQKPNKLIVIDASEFNLYQIEETLNTLQDDNKNKTKISTFLCSVLNKDLIKKIFEDNKIDTVFHAAAYKHVPIVEKNPLIGFSNNVYGTKIMAELAIEFKVSTFTLISTDKAVNPTNIMGVTKRLSEMVCQSLTDKKSNTAFAIVRFGNVLGSSGSVIPKFEKQIQSGGPITVTHKKINRYFMSISEAAELVIQASAMAKKCEFFVLDMGKPVYILDLAKRLCSLKGLTSYCVEEGTYSGDIEIRITGLRKAEKMYEEILTTNKTNSTEHPRIFSAHEEYINSEKLSKILDQLKKSLELRNGENIKRIFSSIPHLNYYKNNMLDFCKNLSKNT